jgi:hypothetical protein
MSSPASGSLRGLRAAVIAVAGTLLAAAAHVAGGGRLPDAGTTAIAMVIPALGGLWLSRCRRGWLSIAGVLSAVQLVLHSWFMAATPTAACVVHAGGHAGHLGVASVRCEAGPGMAGMGLAATPTAGASTHMVLAHIVAVAATALVLAAGERALWQLLQWLRPVLDAVVGRTGLPVPRRLPRVVGVQVPLTCRRSRVGLGGTGRRGPPSPVRSVCVD